VNEHIGNTFVGLLYRAFYLMRNLMSFMHGNFAVHSHMKIDIKIQTHFAHQALFDFDYSRNGGRGISNGIGTSDPSGWWRKVIPA